MAGSPRIDELKKKFDENPGRYFAPLANEYRKAGQIEQAIEICRMYLAEKPGHMSGLIVFGQALFEARQFEEARTTFEQALALDPENLIALRHLGDISREIGDPIAAKGWYQRVLDADPRNEEIAAALAAVAVEAEAAGAPAAAEAASSGMSGWGDINPEGTDAAASTLLIPTDKPMSATDSSPPAPATPARASSVEIPRISLDMGAIDAAETPAPFSSSPSSVAPPGVTPSSVTPSSASPDARTLEFVPPTIPDTKRPSLGISSLGIEQAQEFDSSIATGGSGAGGGIELDRPFEGPPSTSSGSPLGLESTEFQPPEEEIPAPRDSISGFVVEEPPAWETQREEPAPPTPAPSFVTETMAELYLKQGYRSEALGVYRQLVEQNPGDSALREKLQRLETPEPARGQAPASAKPIVPPPRRSGGRTIRTFFGSLGARKAPARAATESGPTEAGVTGPSDWVMEPPAPAPTPEPAPAEEPAAAADAPVAFGASASEWPEPATAAAPTPAESGGWGIAPVTPAASPSKTPSPKFGSPVVSKTPSPKFGSPVVSKTPTPAATRAVTAPVTPAETPAAPASGSVDSLFSGKSVQSEDVEAAKLLAGAFGPPQPVTPSSTPQFPGQPARAASSELSLDNVFRDTPRKSGGFRTTGGFSFDQFFSDDAAGREKDDKADTEKPTPASGSRDTSGGDEAQFSSWLEGLKKK